MIKNFLRAKKRQRDAAKNFDAEAWIARSKKERDKFHDSMDAAMKPTAAQKKFDNVIGTCLLMIVLCLLVQSNTVGTIK